MDWWAGQEAWLRCSAPLLGGAVCRGHSQYPAFAPSTSVMTVGLWRFCILLFIIAPSPSLSHLALFPFGALGVGSSFLSEIAGGTFY